MPEMGTVAPKNASGSVVPMARPWNTTPDPDNSRPALHYMSDLGDVEAREPSTYKDFIGVRGGNVRYTYKVCEAGTGNCSNEVTVRFGGPPL